MVHLFSPPESTDMENPCDGGYCPAKTYTDLRSLVFGIDLSNLAQRRSDTVNRVWGVVMEAGYPQAVITLLALADGTVSVYLSTGGGLTGLGDYEQISNASQRLIGLAAECTELCEAAYEFPLPQQGHTRFYLLTYLGTLAIEAAGQDLDGPPAVAPLFHRGHELLEEIRGLGERLALHRADHPGAVGSSH